MNLDVMEGLLLATGATGGWTLMWLTRTAAALFTRRRTAEAHFGPGTLDRVLRELAAARREVLLFADSLACPAVAQALAEAKGRKCQVDVVFGAVVETDPESSVGTLMDRGLSPLVIDHADRLSGNVILIDGRTLLIASGPLHPDEEQHSAGCHVAVIKNDVELIGTFREHLHGSRTRARPARRTLGPAATAPVFPSYTSPVPPPAHLRPVYHEPEVQMPPPTPAVSSLLSRPLATFEPPAEDEDLRTMPPRRPQPPPLSDEDEDELPDEAPSGAPPVTLAAAEMFARLRREVAARADEPVVPVARPGA